MKREHKHHSNNLHPSFLEEYRKTVTSSRAEWTVTVSNDCDSSWSGYYDVLAIVRIHSHDPMLVEFMISDLSFSFWGHEDEIIQLFDDAEQFCSALRACLDCTHSVQPEPGRRKGTMHYHLSIFDLMGSARLMESVLFSVDTAKVWHA